jgi:hypothetical protein
MTVCGIEISGNDAIICLLKYEEGLFVLPECRSNRIQCANPDRTEDLVYFQKTFIKLAEDYKIDQFAIRARQKKGKFAGGANGFKLEAVLQVAPGLNTQIINASEQKQILSETRPPFSFNETGLKKFQEAALMVGFCQIARQR